MTVTDEYYFESLGNIYQYPRFQFNQAISVLVKLSLEDFSYQANVMSKSSDLGIIHRMLAYIIDNESVDYYHNYTHHLRCQFRLLHSSYVKLSLLMKFSINKHVFLLLNFLLP